MDKNDICEQFGLIAEYCTDIKQLVKITRDSAELNELYRYTLILDIIIDKISTLCDLVDKFDISISHQETNI